MNAEQRQMAADLWAKLMDLSRMPACRLLGNYTIAIYDDDDNPQPPPQFSSETFVHSCCGRAAPAIVFRRSQL